MKIDWDKVEWIENWTGPGFLLVTQDAGPIKKGENYIAKGFSGENVFTATKDLVGKKKVVGRTADLEWGKTGNNTINDLPILKIES